MTTPPALIMGIVNTTPDSFSDGGRFVESGTAIDHSRSLVADGAAIIDVGGESTRPGATRVPSNEEERRVLPVIEALAADGTAVSVDTLNASTALAAVSAGARYVNDVSGGLSDPAMFDTVAAGPATIIIGHWRGNPATMNSLAHYTDVAGEVRDALMERVEAAEAAGIGRPNIILDPGLGFAKNSEHNWRILAELERLTALGFPVLVGASRKRFVGELLPADASAPDRDLASAVVNALAARAGAWAVRTHNVRATHEALSVLGAWQAGSRA